MVPAGGMLGPAVLLVLLLPRDVNRDRYNVMLIITILLLLLLLLIIIIIIIVKIVKLLAQPSFLSFFCLATSTSKRRGEGTAD